MHVQWLCCAMPVDTVHKLRLLTFAVTLFAGFSVQTEAQTKVGGVIDVAVKDKLFPKKGKIEINGPNFGSILNQSYIDSFLLHGGLTYYLSETWGIGIEGTFVINSDKAERECLDYFINDPDNLVEVECSPNPGDIIDSNGNVSQAGGALRANYGPAYVPIRELGTIVAVTATWNPVYAKQLLFLSSTNYFDLFLTFGGGLAMSNFYPKKTEFTIGGQTRQTRGARAANPGEVLDLDGFGVYPDEQDADLYYGPLGRPEPLSETNPLITLGVGQRYHFLKRFNVKVELRNYTLIGTEAGFDSFFALWGGLGVRF